MRFLLISILALCGLTASTASAAGFTQANFAKSSRFATGKWVKISIDKTGVYEISYEALRNMGFANPRKVGLYGRGGRQFPKDFLSPTSICYYFDDISPVPVYQATDKIYFYAAGTEELKYQINTTSYSGGAALLRESNNLYNKEGYYFLSDCQAPLIMEKVNSTGLGSVTEMTSGVSYVYHEKDLYHNLHNTGQLFYGEKMTPENPRLRFDVYLPGLVPGTTGAVECVNYNSKISSKIAVNMEFGFEGSDEVVKTSDRSPAATDYSPQVPSLASMSIPGENVTFYTECDFSNNGGADLETANLDYWIITYNRTIPTLIDKNGNPMAAEYICFPRIPRNGSRKIRISNGINRLVMDITDPYTPHIIDLYHDGPDGIAKIKNDIDAPQIMIIDPTMPQMQVKNIMTDFKEIANQNIHMEAVNGADLIIICIPQLKESAQRLAEIHRNKLNQRVIVATTEECYNEFSAGLPDPMAYRALVKMAYTSDYGCKNLLLMGPLYADFRGIMVDKNPEEGIIAYQSDVTNIERGGFNANDFYGMMIDYRGYTPLENQKIQVGVAILPIRYPAEAETYLKKIEDYIDRDDHAYHLNRFLSIGGVGDSDLHTAQVPEVDAHINNLEDRTVINTQLAIDAYGYDEAHDKFIRTLDEGVNMVFYYGHGGPNRLNHLGNFFNSPDIMKLRNSITPIWGFAGCALSEPDRGIRGMGESLVTATPHGTIGSVLATRETWSSMNVDFFKKLTSNFLRDGGLKTSKPYYNPVTIGEIFARTKTHSTYTNELAYQLVCDPAIIIPTINRYIYLDKKDGIAREGDWMDVSGYIASPEDSTAVDNSFNGEVVLRLMEPMKSIACPHLVLKAQHENCPSQDVMITYADTQVAMAVAEVKDGRFTAKLMIPEGTGKFDGQMGRLHLCAYDHSKRMGAAGLELPTYKVAETDAETTLSSDNQAPIIERLEYSLEANSLDIRVSDNLALAYDADPLRAPFRLMIDGKEYRAGASSKPRVDKDAVAYEKTVTLHDLQEGTHTAKVVVRDAAGNDASAEIVFDYLPTMSRFSIALEQAAVDGEGRFIAINDIPAQADLVILSPEGSIIHRGQFKNGAYQWDACDNNGNKVAPGLYKAYLIETGTNNRKGHSELINVPVI